MKFEERWRPQYCFFNRTKKTYYENGNTRTSWLSLGPDYGALPLAHLHTYIYYGFPSKKGFSLFICQSKCWTNRKGDLVDEPLDLVHLLRLCDQPNIQSCKSHDSWGTNRNSMARMFKCESLLNGRHADNLGYVNSVDEAHKLIAFETGLTTKFSFCNADKGFGNTDQ